MAHTPDRTRLTACVSGWQEVRPDAIYNDGQQILAAVPIGTHERWYYEYHVLNIRVDEDYFDLETSDGDSWEWDISDVDFYVTLAE
jgi:hypothetical protein